VAGTQEQAQIIDRGCAYRLPTGLAENGTGCSRVN
jgi:hypothetical protein